MGMMMRELVANFRTRTLSRGDRVERFGRLSFRLVTALAAARVALRMGDLTEHVYGDVFDGGAEWPENSIAVLFVKARAKLARLGLMIVLERYNFGWRLVELEREAAE
jgi:hypothetical protein